jgi:ribonuclease HII
VEILKHLGLEAYRLCLLRGLDEHVLALGYSNLAGVDEAGRGCLAGPVVAAAVIMRPDHMIPGIDDSKKLSSANRDRLARAIRQTAQAYSVGTVSAAVIDHINILQATRRAMVQALDGLDHCPDCVIVDAVKLPPKEYSCLNLVRGDAVSYSVACASILAKVERDRLMIDLDSVYPEYGFSRNKGYGAAEHRAALIEYGPTPAHRLTFRSVIPRQPEVAN